MAGFAQLFVNFNSLSLLFAFLERPVNEIRGIVWWSDFPAWKSPF